MLQKYNIISSSIVKASEHYRVNYSLLVEYCVELRKQNKETIRDLCGMFDISRQRLSKFEKLELHDMILASNIIEFFGGEISFTRKNNRKWLRK